MRRSELHALLLSIYGCDALEVPVALTEVEQAEPGGSLEVPVALAEVEGVEPSGSLEVPVALAEVEERNRAGHQRLWLCSASCAVVSPLAFRRCRRAAVVVFVVVENVIV